MGIGFNRERTSKMLDTVSQNNLVALPASFYATQGLPVKTSENYAAIPTYRVIHALEKEGYQVVYAAQRSVRKKENAGYQLHVAKLRHESAQGSRFLVPEIALLNSSNGTSGFKLVSGAHVFACANGLCFAKDLYGSFFVPHRGKDLIERILLAASGILRHAEQASSVLTEWQAIHVPYHRQLDFAFHARALRFEPLKTDSGKELWPVEAGDLLECRHFEQREDNLFNVYNRIQESLVRGGLRSLTSKGKYRSTRHIKSIEQDIALNGALFELAKQYA